jgi:D-glycero-D-manno-heptose 1,7-bisphosphate phosphatase
MLLQAASELGLDLAASWMVGDLISDVLAGLNAGCRSILVASGQTRDAAADHLLQAARGRYATAPDFAHAADLILSGE